MSYGAPFSIVHKRKTLLVLHDNEVRCPRKSPLGDVIAVVRCVETFEMRPEGCGQCRQHLESKVKANRLAQINETSRTTVAYPTRVPRIRLVESEVA